MVDAGSVVEFATRSGPLYVHMGAGEHVLDFPARGSTHTSMPKAQLECAVGTAIREIWESVDRYVCILEDEAAVRSVKPDFAALSALPMPGLIVTAPGDECDFVSRYFAPAKGVTEDPVTGTSHCTLAPFWGKRLGKTSLRARQLSARGGKVDCSIQDGRVRLGGACRFYLSGSITVPADGADPS